MLIRLAALASVALISISCGDDPTTVETVGPGDTAVVDSPAETDDASPSTIAGPEGTSAGDATSECTVSSGATGPIFDAELQAAYGDVQPGQREFDWNDDGAPDTLRFEASTDSVIVDHGDGSFTATGVPSDFDAELYGPEVEAGLQLAGPDGPPSAEAFAAGRAGPTPAAVGDFTGDGRPDLAVLNSGELVVHAASSQDGAESAGRDVADAATSSTSWSSPRLTTDLPFDEATVVAVGDINGDGIGDLRVDSYAPRASVSPAFYLGKPCGG